MMTWGRESLHKKRGGNWDSGYDAIDWSKGKESPVEPKALLRCGTCAYEIRSGVKMDPNIYYGCKQKHIHDLCVERTTQCPDHTNL